MIVTKEQLRSLIREEIQKLTEFKTNDYKTVLALRQFDKKQHGGRRSPGEKDLSRKIPKDKQDAISKKVKDRKANSKPSGPNGRDFKAGPRNAVNPQNNRGKTAYNSDFNSLAEPSAVIWRRHGGGDVADRDKAMLQRKLDNIRREKKPKLPK